MGVTNATVLLPILRRQIGDIDTPYTYSDVTLSGYVLDAVKALGRRWNNKYYIATVAGVPDQIVRTGENYSFDFSDPPVIEYGDERCIILQASIIIKTSKKFSESGDAVSWRDEEVAYSSIESAKQRASSLQDDIAELDRYLPIRLARPLYGRLAGWHREYE